MFAPRYPACFALLCVCVCVYICYVCLCIQSGNDSEVDVSALPYSACFVLLCVENMLLWILKETNLSKELYDEDVKLKAIKIWETDTSFAEWTNSDDE